MKKVGLWYLFFLPLGISLSERIVLPDCIVLLFILHSLFDIVRGKSRLCFSFVDGFFLMFCGISLLGHYVFFFKRFFLTELLALSFAYLSFKLVKSSIKSEADLVRHLRWLSSGFFLSLLLNFLLFLATKISVVPFPGAEHIQMALQSSFKRTYQLGISFVVLFPICATVFLSCAYKRLLAYAMLLLISAATGSRSIFWSTFAIIVCVELIIYFKTGWQQALIKGLILGFVVLLSIQLSLGSDSFRRASGDMDLGQILCDNPRITILNNALNTSEYWIRGFGLGCYKGMGLRGWEIHNSFVSIFVETGIGGFVVFFLFLVFSIKPLFMANAPTEEKFKTKASIVVALFGALIMALFFNTTRNRATWTLLAICSQVVYLGITDAKTLAVDQTKHSDV